MSEGKELLFSVSLADCKVETFRSGGRGGQHQNKTESGVRITHLASGAIGESREERSQHQNKRIAFRRMAEDERFKKWCRLEAQRRLGIINQIEQKVEEALQPQNLKVEIQREGRWVEAREEMK